jgi:hypothetical protein
MTREIRVTLKGGEGDTTAVIACSVTELMFAQVLAATLNVKQELYGPTMEVEILR